MADRERRWEERLAVPVLLAALASVPAVFLTLLEEPFATVGTTVNWASGAVLVTETVVLFAVSVDKRAWLRRHLWLLLLTLVIAIGALLAIGPVQLLRLLRLFGALRIVRAGRIVKAARVLRERFGLTGTWSRVPPILAGLLVAVFVAVVLADPTSQTHQLLASWFGEDMSGPLGVVVVVIAGTLLAAATFLVAREQRREED